MEPAVGRLGTWSSFEQSLEQSEMQKASQTTIPANQVMALFADRVRSFSLARGATLSDLAECLTHSDGWSADMPKAIYLTFGAARQPVPVRHSAT
jgi:hypothetical protein